MIVLRIEEIVGRAHLSRRCGTKVDRLLCAARCWQAERLPYNPRFPWKQNGYKLDRFKRSSLPRWIATSETASAACIDVKTDRGKAALNS
jgi:hypothetical protein